MAYSIQLPGPPFPLFVIAYVVNGFGGALQVSRLILMQQTVADCFTLRQQDAQANGFVASYKDNAATKMGFLHAAYGERQLNVGFP